MSEYDGYHIKQLWQMVDAARQGLQPSHDQVAALNKAQQMLSGHAQSLEGARDQLAAKWPPETNAASAAYLTELDRLIAAVKDTALSCAVNVFHINTVSDAIIQAHDKLAPLHTEFVKNESALAQYDADVKSFGDGASLIPGGSTIASGAARLFTSPPVDDGRQDELTKQAQQAMVPLAGAAQDGATYIKPPAPYEPPTVNNSPVTSNPNEFGGSAGGSGSSGAARPPAIDPPAYSRTQGDTTSTTPGQTGDVTTQPPANDSGPILSGYTPTPVQPAPSPVPVGPGPGTGGQTGLLPGLIRGLGGSPIGLGTPAGGYGGRLPSPLGQVEAGPGRGPFGNVAAPGSSVIGNVPSAPGAGRSTPSQVNPRGGVIGQQPGAGSKGGANVAGSRTATGNSTKTVGSPARRWRRGTDVADGQRWDPENPWEVDEGIDPVIMPVARPGPVDPGPGIIGIDR